MHKSRKLLTAAAVSMALTSTQGFALTLGDIEMRSALNQPMNARIPLQSAVPGELDALQVKLASPEAFARAGLERNAALNSLSFQVDRSAAGAPTIRVSSTQPVVEPFLNFLLEVDWSQGRMVREYTVLLDPPVFMSNDVSQRASVSESITTRATDQAGVPVAIERATSNDIVATTAAFSGQRSVQNVEFNFDSSSVAVIGGAEEVGDSIVIDDFREELVVSNSGEQGEIVELGSDNGFPAGGESVELLSDDSLSDIGGGFADDGEIVVLDESGGFGELPDSTEQLVPGSTDLGGEVVTLTDPTVSGFDNVVAGNFSIESIDGFDIQVVDDAREVSNDEGPLLTDNSVASGSRRSTSGAGEVSVNSGDTLFEIARANKADGQTTEQMMLALLEANQQAFINGNINLVRAGAILRIPDSAEVSGLSQAQALSEVAEQEQLWREYRDSVGSSGSTRVAQQFETESPAADTSLDSDAASDSAADAVSDSSNGDNSAASESGVAASGASSNATDADSEGTAISPSAQEILDQARRELEQARNELRLVGDGEATDTASSTSADETDQPDTNNLGALNSQLQLAREELAATRLRTEELQSRDEDLEGTAERMDALVNLRQDEVARLEQQLVDARNNIGNDASTDAAAADASTDADASAGGSDADSSASDGAAQVELVNENSDSDAAATDENANGSAVVQAESESASTRVVQPVRSEAPAEDKPWYARLFSDNKLLIAGGIGLLALLGLFATMFKRRRKTDQFDAFDEDDVEFIDDIDADGRVGNQAYAPEPDEGAMHDADFDTDESGSRSGAAVAAGGAGLAAAGAAVVHAGHDEHGDEVDSTLLHDDAVGDGDHFSASVADAEQAFDDTLAANDATGSDTISEADVYLAYGLHGQAEDLLKNAIAENPDNPEYHAKLLSTYHAQNNTAAFDDAAEDYKQRFAGTDRASWDEISRMGAELNPTNPLYGGGGGTGGLTGMTAAAGGAVAAAGAATAAGASSLFGGDSSNDAELPADNFDQSAAAENWSDTTRADHDATLGDTHFMDQTMDPGTAFAEADLEATGDFSSIAEELRDDRTVDSLSLPEHDDNDSTLLDMGGSLGDSVGNSVDSTVGGGLDRAGDALGSAGESISDASSGFFDKTKAAVGGAAAGAAGLATGAAGAIGLGSDDKDQTLDEMADSAEGSIEFDSSIEPTALDLDSRMADASDNLSMPSAADDLSLDLDQLSGDLDMGSTDLLGSDTDLEIPDLTAADLGSDSSLSLGDADEMDTMMDLAKAYIDMGDNDSASSALGEIVKSGSPQQRSEAENLLRKIS